MKTTAALNLIEGQFATDEAKEILMNIFLTKIQFHEMRNFSSQERLGKDDEVAVKRIPALKKSLAQLEEILIKANTDNKLLKIHADIHISFVEA